MRRPLYKCLNSAASDDAYILGTRSLLSLPLAAGDSLSFAEVLKPCALEVGHVEEHVASFFAVSMNPNRFSVSS